MARNTDKFSNLTEKSVCMTRVSHSTRNGSTSTSETPLFYVKVGLYLFDKISVMIWFVNDGSSMRTEIIDFTRVYHTYFKTDQSQDLMV